MVALLTVCGSDDVRTGLCAHDGGVLRRGFLALTQQIGFCLKDVTVFGRNRTTQQEILQATQIKFGESIFKYDVNEMRDKLRQLAWVGEVGVRRNLCGRIYININERVPIAVYHCAAAGAKDGFFLIDKFGERIRCEILPCFRGLPVLSGKNSDKKSPEILAMLELFPEVRAEVTALAFIQERRWNLKLSNTVEVKLPEQLPENALAVLVALLKHGKLSSGDVTYVDLRIPGKVILGLSKASQNFFKCVAGAKIS
jgi:cell division protein FtsQ